MEDHSHKWKRNGKDRNGNQRSRCTVCNRTRYERPIIRRPQYERTLKAMGVAEYFIKQGYSVRYAARQAGTSKRTVEIYCKELLARKDLKCGCGGPRGHKGWCQWLYQQSPVRQWWVQTFHRDLTEAEEKALKAAGRLYGGRCKDCGIEVKSESTRCQKCYRAQAAARKEARKANQPYREEMKCLRQGRKLLQQIKRMSSLQAKPQGVLPSRKLE